MDLFSRFIGRRKKGVSLCRGGDTVRCFEKWVVRDAALNIAFNGVEKKHVTLITEKEGERGSPLVKT
jgi:hypothetical protein